MCLALAVWCHVCAERADKATNLLGELDDLLSKRTTLTNTVDEMKGAGLHKVVSFETTSNETAMLC